MKPNKLYITAHAWKRFAQRNLTLSDVLLTLQLGRRVHRAHADFYCLLGKSLPKGKERELERLVGTVVVLEGNTLTTAYRNRQMMRRLKRKARRFSGDWRAARATRQTPLSQMQSIARA